MTRINAVSGLMAQKVSIRLIVAGLLASFGISLVLSVVQFFFELHNQEKIIKSEIERTVLSANNRLVTALQLNSKILTNEIATSLISTPYMLSVTIVSNERNVNNTPNTMAQLTKEREDHSVPLILEFLVGEHIGKYSASILDPKHPNTIIGTLDMSYDIYFAVKYIFKAQIREMFFQVLQAISIAAMLIFIFNKIIVKPLLTIANQIKNIDVHDSQGKRISQKTTHRQDELGVLISNINTYISVVESEISAKASALKKAEIAQLSINALFENLPHIISVRNLDGKLLLANQNYLRTFEVSKEQVESGYGIDNFKNLAKSAKQIMADADAEALITQSSILIPEIDLTLNSGKTISLEVRKLAIDYMGQRAIVTVGSDITERRRHQAKVQHMAYHDPLTNLPNRHLFLDRLDQALLKAQRSKNYGALIFVDLDNFKTHNDQRGHLFGDDILSQTALRLKVAIRDHDTVARLGGDEFVICMTDLDKDKTPAHEIGLELTERIHKTIQKPLTIEGITISISASLGIVFFNNANISGSELLKHADMAMYKAKENGKNTIIEFENEMAESEKRKTQLKRDCKLALSNDQFFLAYQPQIDSTTNKCIGVEALLRWDHPTSGLIPPNEFIPLLEKSGLMPEVGQWVLRKAIEQLSYWKTQKIVEHKFKMSINVSPQQFSQKNFAQMIKDVIQKLDIQHNTIDLEITESMIIEDIDHTIASMNELRDLGMNFSIDDFGTGYSNLNNLKRLPLDILKVDQSFVKDIDTNEHDRSIVKAIISMANQLNLMTIAEGVETHAQLDLLQKMGCHVVQGYLYSRPLNSTDVEKLLSR